MNTLGQARDKDKICGLWILQRNPRQLWKYDTFHTYCNFFVHIQCSKSPVRISLDFCQFIVPYALLLFMISSIYWINSASAKLVSEITEVLMKCSLKIHEFLCELKPKNLKAEAIKHTAPACFRNYFWIF